jgi:hypothetical protein
MPEVLVTYALISLADVKEGLGISNASQDNLLTRYINQATDLIEKFCNGRRFKETTYTNQEYNGSGTAYLDLRHYPLSSITKLERRTSTDYSASDFDEIDTSDYLIDSGSQTNTGQVYMPIGFIKGIRNYRITYVAGYSSIPNDLEEACGKLVSYFLKTANKNEGVKSETLGRYSITYDKGSYNKDRIFQEAGIIDTLELYRMPTV